MSAFKDKLAKRIKRMKRKFAKIFVTKKMVDKKYHLLQKSQDFRKDQLMRRYKNAKGFKFDWNNIDGSFNQRVLYRIAFENSELMPLLTDKVQMKSYLKSFLKADYFLETYQVTNVFDEINFASLPSSFVIKANNASGEWGIALVKDKQNVNKEKLEKKFNQVPARLKEFVNLSGEVHYCSIPPKLMVEEYLAGDFMELQFFVFQGEDVEKLRLFYGSDPRGSISLKYRKRNTVNFAKTDMDTFVVGGEDCLEKVAEIPQNHQIEMLELGKKIVNELNLRFARVDFFYSFEKQRIVIGEITFTPAAGTAIAYDEYFEGCGENTPLLIGES